MGAEHGDGAFRHLVELIDEDRATLAQILDHMAVMDDFVPHIDRRTVFDERPLHDIDRADDARAEAAGLSQEDTHSLSSSPIGRPGR